MSSQTYAHAVESQYGQCNEYNPIKEAVHYDWGGCCYDAWCVVSS